MTQMSPKMFGNNTDTFYRTHGYFHTPRKSPEKQRCLRHCLSRKGFGHQTQQQLSPTRREGALSRDSSLDNLNPLLGQSARYHKSPNYERTLNHKNSEIFSQSTTTQLVEEDGPNVFGKRLYSSKAANRLRNVRILKMKQVQIKNMDLVGI